MRNVWLWRLAVGLLVVGLAAPAVVLAQDDDNPRRPTEEGVEAPEGYSEEALNWDVWSIVEVPEALRDAAFDRHVDLAALGRALDQLDPVGLADAALQLAEGERVLLRSHKSFTADKVFALAVRTAADKHDQATLDRLTRAAASRGDAWKARVKAAKKLAASERAVEPALSLSVDKVDPEEFAVYQRYLREIQKASVFGGAEELAEMEALIGREEQLSDDSRAALRRLAGDAREAAGQGTAQEDPGRDALKKLAAGSRGFGIRTFIPKRVDPFAGRWPTIGGRREESTSTLAVMSYVTIRNPTDYTLKFYFNGKFKTIGPHRRITFTLGTNSGNYRPGNVRFENGRGSYRQHQVGEGTYRFVSTSSGWSLQRD